MKKLTLEISLTSKLPKGQKEAIAMNIAHEILLLAGVEEGEVIEDRMNGDRYVVRLTKEGAEKILRTFSSD